VQTIEQSPATTYQQAERLTAEAQDAIRSLRQSLRTMLLQIRGRGVTQQAVADRVGVSQSRLSQWIGREAQTLDARAVLRAFPAVEQVWREVCCECE
jgi:DNA-directed RNA polymerase specialized sigma24 family protein